MSAGILHWLLAASLLAMGSSHLLAQERNLSVAAAANEQRVALVIGNSAYNEAPLRNPANDATDMAAMLRSLGFAVTLKTNADTRQMRAAIREFAQSLKRGGVGLFYFAGHGVQSRNGRNYLIPVGADLKEEFELEDEAVDANRVLAGMEEAGNRVNIVILDACRNNPFARSWRSTASGLAQMNAPSGSFVGFATAPGQVAADGSGRNGLYTKHLLENLKTGDPDIDRVFTRVTAAVARETGNKQVPWKTSSLTGDFYFRTAPDNPQAASVTPTAPAPVDPSANDRTFWESVKDSKAPDEIRAYLDRFPEGLFAPLAQTRLRAIQSELEDARKRREAAQLAESDQRRSASAQAADEEIERLSANRVNDQFGNTVHINFASFNRKLLLTGEAPDSATKSQIEQIVRQTADVRAILNEIRIAGASSFFSRGKDSYLTSRINARLNENSNESLPRHFKVITESGAVYLMGLVTRKEADVAVQIARGTSGVEKVVPAFEYVDAPTK